MSEVIYDNVIRTETLNRGERIEMMVDIYESSDSVRNHEVINTERQQACHHTGSVSVKNRRHRAVQVCLWLFCVLLLTAVVVLCVYFTTDRNRLLTQNHNLTKEREKILKQYTEILNLNRNLTEEREEIKNLTDELLNALQDWHSGKWIYYDFSFYHFSTESKSWSDSRQDCKQRGADLVIINSKEEQELLQKFTDKHNFYWIGLNKRYGAWRWVDDTALTTRHWINGYPNTYKGICAVTSTSGWTHYSCDRNLRWICEKRF